MLQDPPPPHLKEVNMTKSQAFTHANPLVVAKMYATNASDNTLAPLIRFLNRKNKLPKSVIPMMVLYIIAVLNQNLPVNEVYYRKVQEDWLERKLITPEAALKYYTEAMEISKNKPAVDPDKQLRPGKVITPVEIDPEVERALDSVFHNIR